MKTIQAKDITAQSSLIFCFLIGLFAQAGQIIMFREVMAMFHGTELLFGSILGSSVLWTSLGAAAAEFFLNRRFGTRFFPTLLVYSILFNGFLLGLQILFLRFYPVIFSTAVVGQAFSFYGAIWIVFLASFPFAFLMGAQFTLALRLNSRARLGLLYRVESIGAAVGGMMTSFVLVEAAPPLRIVFFVGALFIVGSSPQIPKALLTLKAQPAAQKESYHRAKFGPQTGSASRFTPYAVVCLLVFLAVLPLDKLSLEFCRSKKSSGFFLENIKESKYGRIEVIKNPVTGQNLVFHNSSLVSNIESGFETPFEKHLADICLTQHPAPKSVLLIGGVLSSLPENILKHNIKKLKAVEQDPLLFDIYINSRESPPLYWGHQLLSVVHEDGRSFVFSEPTDHYDLVIVFCPEPDNASVNRYCTREFFLQVDRILKSGGVLCLFLPTHGAAHEYLAGPLMDRTASIYKALKYVYKDRLAIHVNGHLLIGSQYKNRVSTDPEVLGKRLSSRPGARPFYRFEEKGELRKEKIPENELAAYFSALFGGILEQEDFFSDTETRRTPGRKFQEMLEASQVRVNLDSHPAAVYYSMRVWEGITAANGNSSNKNFLSRIFNLIGQVKLIDLMVFPGVIILFNSMFLIIAFPRYSKKVNRSLFPTFLKKYPILLAAFITGSFSITTEIILLSLYQSQTGYLYFSVGILLAIFMGGLALGAKVTDRYTRNPWFLLTVIFLSMILLCCLTGYSSHILSGLESRAVLTSIFGLLMLMNGLLCGAAFPLLGFLSAGWKCSRPGAWIYAFDLAGAGVGAFFIAPFLIPAVGIQNTLILLAILLFSLLFLSIPLATKTRNQKKCPRG
jgi:spermidine synthase